MTSLLQVSTETDRLVYCNQSSEFFTYTKKKNLGIIVLSIPLYVSQEL